MGKARSLANLGAVYDDPASLAWRNRVINGDMRVDQRNTGAVLAIPGASGGLYTVDRFNVYRSTTGATTAQRSSVAPAGFSNSLLFTVTTTDAAVAAGDVMTVNQTIEGHNIADLGWGTSTASPVTASFWVRASVTGTYCCSVSNYTGTRTYVREYTISAANTWQKVVLTFPGDTTGTWATDNSGGIGLSWTLMAGTNFQTPSANTWNTANLVATSNQVNFLGTLNATWQITGVQLEAGSVPTPFERVEYGEMLRRCQRYFQGTGTVGGRIAAGTFYSSTQSVVTVPLPVRMRAVPTVTFPALGMVVRDGIAWYAVTSASAFENTTDMVNINLVSAATGATAGYGTAWGGGNGGTVHVQISAEL